MNLVAKKNPFENSTRKTQQNSRGRWKFFSEYGQRATLDKIAIASGLTKAEHPVLLFEQRSNIF